MRGKQGRRARRLLLHRGSLAHHIMILGNRCTGCEGGCEAPIQLTARKAPSTTVGVHIKPDEFSQLLWGAQSWRRPH